eukprot:3216782-Prymnesium_polylepis.1
MKLRNSLFRLMLCSASTLHLAVDAKFPVSGRTVLPGPGGQNSSRQPAALLQGNARERRNAHRCERWRAR